MICVNFYGAFHIAYRYERKTLKDCDNFKSYVTTIEYTRGYLLVLGEYQIYFNTYSGCFRLFTTRLAGSPGGDVRKMAPSEEKKIEHHYTIMTCFNIN